MALSVSSDAFDIPARLIPAGVIYQWCSKEPAKDFQKFIAAGWQAVPFGRHDTFFSEERYAAPGGTIEYGGCVLMERCRDQSLQEREMEMDQACLNAGNGRRVAINVTMNMRLSHRELEAAKACAISGQLWATRKMHMIADGSDLSEIHGWDGSLMFKLPELRPLQRRPKFLWLRWLFNLISTTEE